MSICVDIEKRLGSFQLRVKLEAENEILALLGASGCGKSMTLKCIAGIEKPDRGKIVVDGVTLFDSEKHINLSPQARRTGLMFQNYALFPNMTVLQNLRAGAKRDRDKKQWEARVREAAERFGLTALLGHYPHQLSGGQQQRTALARILLSEPRILLLDEPFSALDSHRRFRLEREMAEVLRRFGKTVLLVSHDRDEVYRLSDRVAVMGNGVIETIGEKKSVFAAPKTRNAALLTGCKNVSRAVRLDESHLFAEDWNLRLSVRDMTEKTAFVGIRMHDIRPGEGENSVSCRVVSVTENPFSVTVFLLPEGAETAIGWETDKAAWQAIAAETVTVCLPQDALMPLTEELE